MRDIAATPQIASLLAAHAPVAFGVSGGKDSGAMVLATNAYLDELGHQGPRVLIHSDLGRVEWADSLPVCKQLAKHVGLELITVQRQAGGLMERWQTRWSNNVARYANLECVKLILPWSTASMRFCTSELKTAIICRELVQRFPGQVIISASGIRREESPNRAKAPIAKEQPRLYRRTAPDRVTSGYDWHPIIEWSRTEVLAEHDRHGFRLHEAYTRYGSSRVSCAFCILGSAADLAAAATCADNQAIYREMVDLEIASTFSFHDTLWLGDVAPSLLSAGQRTGLKDAKRRARERAAAEARIPPHLLYTKGWPTVMPTAEEARLIAWVRVAVAEAVDLDVDYTDAVSVLDRYAELMKGRPEGQGTPVQVGMLL